MAIDNAFYRKYKDFFQLEQHGIDESMLLVDQDADIDNNHPSSSSSSFLEQYWHCQTQQMDEWTHAMTSFSSILHLLSARVSAHAMASFPTTTVMTTASHVVPVMASSSSSISSLHPAPSSPVRRPVLEEVDDHHSKLHPFPSPTKASAMEITPSPPKVIMTQPKKSPIRSRQVSRNPDFQLPSLSDLLIDRTTRTNMVFPNKLDDLQRIELLAGVKCVGRVSATSSTVPLAIRKRLHASLRIHERRDQLYALLQQEYHKLTKQ